MNKDSGNLSVDFLAGFTIFILAFIWVATMIPTLLIGLNAHSIDYNAVAYRTGVILAEDPGAAGPVSGSPCFGISSASGSTWESPQNGDWDSWEKCDVARFGLAVSKDTPNVLDENKINRFFSGNASVDPIYDTKNLSYPDDYLKRAIFGDYPYRFNISLKIDGEDKTRYIGDQLPEQDYGYIRRAVLVKSNSSATINESLIKANYWSKSNFTEDTFTILFNKTKLLDASKATPHDVNYRNYQINPGLDTIIINITGLNTLYYNTTLSMTTTSLTDIRTSSDMAKNRSITNAGSFTYIDGNTSPVGTLPARVNNSILLVIPPKEVISESDLQVAPDINLILVFRNSNSLSTDNDTYTAACTSNPPLTYCGNWFINSSASGPFEYDYNTTNVTQPQLRPGILEVAVW